MDASKNPKTMNMREGWLSQSEMDKLLFPIRSFWAIFLEFYNRNGSPDPPNTKTGFVSRIFYRKSFFSAPYNVAQQARKPQVPELVGFHRMLQKVAMPTSRYAETKKEFYRKSRKIQENVGFGVWGMWGERQFCWKI